MKKCKQSSLVLAVLSLAVVSGASANTLVTSGLSNPVSTRLTMYAGQTVVSQTLAEGLPAGVSTLQLRPDFDYWELSTLQLGVQDEGHRIFPNNIFWRRPVSGKNELMNQLLGQNIELYRPGRDTPLKGRLLDWQQDTGVLLLVDGRQEVFQWSEGTSVRTSSINSLPAQAFAPMLEASFALQKPVENISLVYLNGGLRYGNQYRMVTMPEDSSLDLSLSAHLINQSATSYSKASLQLASGDLGDRGQGGQYQSRKMFAMAANADVSTPSPQRFGDLLFIDVPGQYTLPAGGELNVPLLYQKESRYENAYKYSFYGDSHPGNRPVKEHPGRAITFTADNDLPAGPVQVLEQDRDGLLRLVNLGSIPQTASGQSVELALGQSYTLTIERERLNTRQQDKTWTADWQLLVTNSQNQPATVVIEDTDRNLMKMEFSGKVGKTPGRYSVSIPAGKTTTVTFTSTYRKK